MNETTETKKSSTIALVLWTMAFCFGYSILRYHIFGPVPWKDLSFFTLNKSICFTSLVLLIMNFGFGPAKNLGLRIPDSWLNARMAIGIIAFLLVLLHAFMSLLLFSPAVYPQFFEVDSKMTLNAGLSMLGGVIAFIILWGYNLSFKTTLREDMAFIAFITSRKFLLWAMLFTGAHLVFMGYSGWLNPQGWHGGMPPISLVSFALFLAGYVINFLGRE
ncbi:hypothetical protein SAMN05444000_1309 [Shimia gijangensis]|uniref:Ferric oxidoreductase domain-containing protein n=2 Tax=Shimia gijangensis TaxID=1470563 RepID=A0A1M6SJ55_9RHOB|nr:hypothetical protein SAMN05444000_1309 [Shimia gijangensis]